MSDNRLDNIHNLDYGNEQTFLENLDELMYNNTTIQISIPPKKLRNKIVDHCAAYNYHPVIITPEKLLYKNEKVDLLEAAEPFVEPRFKRFEAAFVIGDVHGCLRPLEAILKHSRGYPIVFAGDLVDKRPDESGVLDLVYELLSKDSNKVAFTPGNHDTSYKYRIEMDGAKRSQYISDKIDKVLEFRSDWVEGLDWIVTHSPCNRKYLKKCDPKSLMKSINFRRFSSGLTTRQKVEDKMKTWAREDYHNHIFGHVAFDDVWRYKNLIGIDTGCVYGGKLTGFFTDTNTYVMV